MPQIEEVLEYSMHNRCTYQALKKLFPQDAFQHLQGFIACTATCIIPPDCWRRPNWQFSARQKNISWHSEGFRLGVALGIAT